MRPWCLCWATPKYNPFCPLPGPLAASGATPVTKVTQPCLTCSHIEASTPLAAAIRPAGCVPTTPGRKERRLATPRAPVPPASACVTADGSQKPGAAPPAATASTDPAFAPPGKTCVEARPSAAASSTRSPGRTMPSVIRVSIRSLRRNNCPCTTRYSPSHGLPWRKIVCPPSKATVRTEAVSTLPVSEGHASNSDSGCAATGSAHLDLASFSIELSPWTGCPVKHAPVHPCCVPSAFPAGLSRLPFLFRTRLHGDAP